MVAVAGHKLAALLIGGPEEERELDRVFGLAAVGRSSLAVASVTALITLVVSAGAESVHAAQSTGGGTRGTPWTGAKGVTETVGQIMARSKSAQAAPMALPIRLAPQRRLAGASSSSLEPKP